MALSFEENEMLTRAGPGTPAGEMLRRYWHPIAFSRELKGRPKRRTLLGEDLVLFRDEQGRLGLLALRCSHRGTSLEYGHLEDGGLRCCYHGWLYDVEGRVLDQPGEPTDSTFRERVRHPAYKVQELAGIVFAYLGPEPAPLLPLPTKDTRRCAGAFPWMTLPQCTLLFISRRWSTARQRRRCRRTGRTKGSATAFPESIVGMKPRAGSRAAIKTAARRRAKDRSLTARGNTWECLMKA